MDNTFIKCGLTGWCLEVFWTGIHAPLKRDKTLTGTTSLWMFPIYGMVSAIKPVKKYIQNYNFVIRGLIYTSCIFAAEFATGSILKKHEMCPWDYSASKHNYKGIIRMDYAPVWFVVGLLYEKIT